MVIKRIRPMSFAKMNGVICAFIGLLIGGMFSLIGLVGGAAMLNQSNSGDAGTAGAAMGMIFGVGAIIIVPICYAIFGFIWGLLGAAVYNLAAGMMGGLELDIQQ
jgi:hypothetical protein